MKFYHPDVPFFSKKILQQKLMHSDWVKNCHVAFASFVTGVKGGGLIYDKRGEAHTSCFDAGQRFNFKSFYRFYPPRHFTN